MSDVKPEHRNAVRECRRLRDVGSCPRSCNHFALGSQDRRLPFCKDAWAAERRA
jgi:hypothetical protein